ncbi:CotH kinase family protein [bacterium]
MKRKICPLLILFLGVFGLPAQHVVINEVMPLNATGITDEEGDYSDWIELYNSGDTSLDLNGFGLTDDPDDPLKWIFPAYELDAHQHLLIFASGKDRKIWAAHWETVIPWGDVWKYSPGSASLPDHWRDIDYDDDSWSVGPSGFGYGDNDDSTVVDQAVSLYMRKTFQVEDLSSIQLALLHMDYDDAFVAYINGIEAARSNIGQSGIEPGYDQTADVPHEARMYQGEPPEVFVIEQGETVFRQGQNILAIQIHNTGATSSDLTAIPFLTLGMRQPPIDPQGVPAPINELMSTFHTNFKISANGETLLLHDDTGHLLDMLEISEATADVSTGREPDGGNHWVCFAEPTPGSSNITAWYEQIASEPQFSVTGGVYSQGTVLYLSTNGPGGSIHYTEDCSEPTAQSPVYASPLLIDETKVIRARVCGSGIMPSSIITHTYLISENLSLPVVCLSTAPLNLWDEQVGIYVTGPNAETESPHYGANFWQDWERPVHIEFFDIDETDVYSASGGVKIFGGWSRAFPQKSLALFARREYGTEAFNYPFFPDKSIQSFQSLVLRNSGNDCGFSMFRDPLMQDLVKSTSLVVQAYRPVVVYLNGEYWGVHNLREKINEHYIASNYDFDPDNLDILEYYEAVIQGESDHYLQMMNYIVSHDMSIPEYYEVVKADMDVNNFIDYQVAQIYFGNTDWPSNNIKFFRPGTEDGLWRWLLFDTDFGFGLYDDFAYRHNTLEFATDPDGPPYPNPPWSTLLIRHLLENIEFRNSFINRLADYMNTIFHPDEVIDHIDSLKTNIESEMENHFAKWGGSISAWQNEVEIMREFARRRNGYVREHILDKFNLEATHTLCLDVYPENAGTIAINTVVPSNYPWEGIYFQKVPVLMAANPYDGFRFLRWEGDATGDRSRLSVDLTHNFLVTAVFEPVDIQIVINEINYHSAHDVDPEDWVELYNNSDFPVDLSGWKFKDSDDTHVYSIPKNTVLNPDAYIVLCRDLSAFGNGFPDVANVLGDLGFGFDGDGELLQLCDGGFNIVDSLTYDDRFPWPTEPDGNGSTLALKNPNLDNAIAENWAASDGYGTPGEVNDVHTGLDAMALKGPRLFQNYPNPFNSSTTLKYELSEASHVTLTIYNLLGEKIETIYKDYQTADVFQFKWTANDLSSGIYLCKFQTNGFSKVNKIILYR